MPFDRALTSVYYHAHSVSFGEEGDAYVTKGARAIIDGIAAREPRAKPLPLPHCMEDLVGAVRSDAPIGLFAGRRAIVKLAGANLLVEAIPLLREFGLEPGHFPDPQAFDTRAAREQHAYEVVSRQLQNLVCKVTPKSSVVSIDEPNETLRLYIAVEVLRPLVDVKVALDPQSWHPCNPYFRATYIIEHDTGNYRRNERPPRRNMGPPTKGKAWDDLLFERFVLVENLVELENVLRFQISSTQHYYEMGYRLDNSMFSEVYWSSLHCGLRRDDGVVKVAEPDGAGRSLVQGVKHLRFVDRRDPLLTARNLVWALAYLIHATSDFAFDYGLCCGALDADSALLSRSPTTGGD